VANAEFNPKDGPDKTRSNHRHHLRHRLPLGNYFLFRKVVFPNLGKMILEDKTKKKILAGKKTKFPSMK